MKRISLNGNLVAFFVESIDSTFQPKEEFKDMIKKSKYNIEIVQRFSDGKVGRADLPNVRVDVNTDARSFTFFSTSVHLTYFNEALKDSSIKFSMKNVDTNKDEFFMIKELLLPPITSYSYKFSQLFQTLPKETPLLLSYKNHPNKMMKYDRCEETRLLLSDFNCEKGSSVFSPQQILWGEYSWHAPHANATTTEDGLVVPDLISIIPYTIDTRFTDILK